MITNKFIHIHLPRTGGQLLRGIIHQNRKKMKIYFKDSHITMEESLKKLASIDKRLKVPTFCVIRNPWDWYVSRYFFRQKEMTKNKIGPQAEIEKCGNSMEGFKKHMKILSKYIKNKEPVEPVKSRNIPRIWQKITISDYFKYLCSPEPKYILKLEEFPKSIIDLLINLTPEVFKREDLNKKLNSKYNSSKHKHYREYYDEELMEMVMDWDKEFIDRFGYIFGEQ